MANLPTYVWLNGRIVTTHEARISPFDRGFTVGDGVFETLVARAGRLVALQRHWRRLAAACKVLGLSSPSLEEMSTGLSHVMEANGVTEARLRFTVTGGEGMPGSAKDAAPPTWMAVATALHHWPATESVRTVPWSRNEFGALAGLKCCSYAENARALVYARAHGAGEALFANTQGYLCEGAGTNLFVVQSGVVITPPLSSGCLPGVTRELVLEACRLAAIPVEEGILPLPGLAQIEEAFLTSSTRGVHPIREVNGRPLANVPGELTQRAAAAYTELVARES